MSHVNSQKKIDYVKQVNDIVSTSKAKMNAVVDELNGLTANIKTAVIDRAFNVIVAIGAKQFEAMDAMTKAIVEDILEPAAKSTIYGEALVAAAKATIPETEGVTAVKFNGTEIPQSVIDGRGLDENFTDANRTAYGEACAKFIKIRYGAVVELGEVTKKYTDVDTEQVYRNIGIKLEEIFNSTVENYNKLKAGLIEAGVLSDKDIAKAEEAGQAIGRVEVAQPIKSIVGGEMDV